MLGILFIISVVLIGSDGLYFPLPNFTGVIFLYLVLRRVKKIDRERNFSLNSM